MSTALNSEYHQKTPNTIEFQEDCRAVRDTPVMLYETQLTYEMCLYQQFIAFLYEFVSGST